MKTYQRIILELLRESSLKNIPDPNDLGEGFILEDEHGFKWTIKKKGKHVDNNKVLYKIENNGQSKVVDFDTIKKEYKRS